MLKKKKSSKNPKMQCDTTRASRRGEGKKKTKLREEENRVKEGQMWDRLAELNGEFKKIKKAKKDSKKMSETIYKFV